MKFWKTVGKGIELRTLASVKSWLVCLAALLLSSALCTLLGTVGDEDRHVPMIFILAVLLVSLLTDGYFYGVLTAVTGVMVANFAFTYPYARVDFSISGYQLTFFTMLAVSIAVSTLTTRLKEQERLRREMEQEKLRANLLRAISHDLRTPLTTISGSLSAVLDGSVQGEALCRELLSSAREDADWLYRMVENLLSITRIGTDGVKGLNKQEEMLEEVLAEAVGKFRKYYPDIRVSVSVPEEALLVPIDAVLVEQVLINLMNNAAIHGKTTCSIAVTAQRQGEFVHLSVCDDGQGIDKDRLAHLFDGVLPLTKAGSSDGSRNLGIGLSVCRTIVEAHGGSISADSRPGHGSYFHFSLALGGEER